MSRSTELKKEEHEGNSVAPTHHEEQKGSAKQVC